ncbi:MAG: diguanylate cyclase [Cyanobacteria bacterium J06632_22]
MSSPSISSLSQERQRLAKLQSYQIMDTPPEPCFDDLVALAAHICEVPVALISLLDSNRQWFKAKVGLTVSETPRNISICDRTIQEQRLFIIEDARLHPDFCHSPLVTGPPHIVFYAGAPLLTPDGYALGSLCVIDYRPRQLNATQYEALTTLGRQVVTQLELMQRTRQLTTVNDSLEKKVEQRTTDLTQAITALQQTQSQLVVQQEKLRHEALHDRLTGLPNRELLARKLVNAIQSAQAEQSQYAVLFIDLDQFKILNDSLGHGVGDQLLKQVTRTIQSLLGANDTLARLGGDEFVMLLDQIPHPDYAISLAEQIQTVLSSPLLIDRHEVFTGASIGITFSHLGYHRPDDALRDADIAMYQAKQAGKRCYVVFDRTMQTRVHQRLSLETDLRRGLINEEFRLFYQPIFELSTHRLVGFEALIRWQHPEQGLIAPDLFIPIAEETGLIHDLGAWIITAAGQQLQRWRRQFPICSPLTLNVNVSPTQLQRPELIAHLKTTLAQTQLPAQAIKLEITEHSVLDTTNTITSVFTQLKQLGFKRPCCMKGSRIR